MGHLAIWRAGVLLVGLRLGPAPPAAFTAPCILTGIAALGGAYLVPLPGRVRCVLAWFGAGLILTAAAAWEADGRPALSDARVTLARFSSSEHLWWVTGSGAQADDERGPRRPVRLRAVAGDNGHRLPLDDLGGRAVLTGVPIERGETWVVRAGLALLPVARNPAGFDAAQHAWRRDRNLGYLSAIGPWAGQSLARGSGASTYGNRLEAVRDQLRHAAASAVRRRVGGDAAELALAMSLGERRQLDTDVVASFRALGWSHLLALSGLHVGFVVLLVAAPIRMAGGGRHLWLTGGPIAYYAWLTVAPPSVLRATLMVGVALIARRAARRLSVGRALSIAAVALLAFEPELAADAGARLSFAAVFGIAVCGPALDLSRPEGAGKSAFEVWVRAPLATGLAAQLGALPVIATTFHTISAWGVLTAPVAIPLAGLTVATTLLGLVTQPFLPWVGNQFLDAAAVGAASLIHLARQLVLRLPPPWPVPSPGVTEISLYAVGAVCLLTARPDRCGRRRLGLVLWLVASAALITPRWTAPVGQIERVRVEVLDVGQGDAALVLVDDRPRLRWRAARPARVFLIDCGDRTAHVDRGARVVAPRLAALGVRRVDHMILTHADRDHIGGATAVLGAVRVGTVHVPPRCDLPSALDSAIDRNGAVLRTTVNGDTLFAADQVCITALHPAAGDDGSDNDRSVVLLIDAFDTAVLLTGDIETAGERTLLGSGHALEVDVLKAGHHGSDTSSSEPFLDATVPRLVLISAGNDARFRHPSPAVIDRLAARGITTLRTDRHGAIIIDIVAGGFTTRTMIDD